LCCIEAALPVGSIGTTSSSSNGNGNGSSSNSTTSGGGGGGGSSSFQDGDWSEASFQRWSWSLDSAATPYELMACVLALEAAVRPAWFLPGSYAALRSLHSRHGALALATWGSVAARVFTFDAVLQYDRVVLNHHASVSNSKAAAAREGKVTIVEPHPAFVFVPGCSAVAHRRRTRTRRQSGSGVANSGGGSGGGGQGAFAEKQQQLSSIPGWYRLNSRLKDLRNVAAGSKHSNSSKAAKAAAETKASKAAAVAAAESQLHDGEEDDGDGEEDEEDDEEDDDENEFDEFGNAQRGGQAKSRSRGGQSKQ
jgi:hypothetical protein